jgi:hypothetical protein
MGNVLTIGLDIAKSVFQVHGVDAASEVVVDIPAHKRCTCCVRLRGDSAADRLGLSHCQNRCRRWNVNADVYPGPTRCSSSCGS